MHFNSSSRLEFLHEQLLTLGKEYSWEMESWAVFPNHYHFIGRSNDPKNLPSFISNLHVTTAKFVNELDNTPKRKVWWQYWDSLITYHTHTWQD
jgi:putative transposase